ncbi:MAG TPA: sigma-70 family RNA polymerase sigma factor [Vicinamibacterales bacterium]|jgi:RNA polymerase sigma-70 factor (ECF subfamily)|nr:sigma-70 family RNA polymerase sigma factor [Vicinamibacterales bacterium]
MLLIHNKDCPFTVNDYRTAGVILMTGAARPAPAVTAREADTLAAVAVKALRQAGDHAGARERFGELVARHQRRASRIAFHYLRDAAEADEAVQDAFVKAYSHLASFREALPFEVWFTRILINGCLDRIKARGRRERWMVPLEDGVAKAVPVSRGLSPEAALLAGERRRTLARALAKLPERQRAVFVLSQCEGHSAREVGEITGLNESTVRVHLFRALRRLRKLLSETSRDAEAI